MQRETVWLVEDEQGIADTLVYMLQQEGFDVEVFERGLPVLDKARQQVPDVMILDVGLPDISGFELCRQLLADAPRDKCTLSCAINGIHAAFHYLKKNYISGCVMTVPTG